MRTIFHIDANSAYLSLTAVDLMKKGFAIDIREVPAVIAGDPKTRRGIILAKSTPAKAYGIVTGESLMEAKRKCPKLLVFPPDHDLYMLYSNAMYQLLNDYSPVIQRYSIDECFLDYTASQKRFGDPLDVAYQIKERIKNELGFTVNIGISTNMLLAKMGSELKKPDRIHTLYPDEIKEKMWPLPVSELFMVGHASAQKLNKINIKTIGELAESDPEHMKALLKSHGLLIWSYANGIDEGEVTHDSAILQKGVGNSTTIDHDVTDRKEAQSILLSLTEKVATRLRKLNCMGCLISVSLKTDGFIRYSHQVKLCTPLNTTSEIYDHVCRLLDESWRGEPIRQLGVSVSDFCQHEEVQLSMFDSKSLEKNQKLDATIDLIRNRYGEQAVVRAVFAKPEK